MRRRGQTATEYMLIISVLVISVVAAAYVFVPEFQSGVVALAGDVKQMLSTGQVGGVGWQRHGGGGAAGPTVGAAQGVPAAQSPSFGGPNVAGANSLNQTSQPPLTGGVNGG